MADETHQDLAPDETELRGAWIPGADGRPSNDAVEERIRWLVAHRLTHVATSADGWDWLFRDPSDHRLWELTYPQGSLHGAGPRRLAMIGREAALARYGRA
jgi:hypothetical protein